MELFQFRQIIFFINLFIISWFVLPQNFFYFLSFLIFFTAISILDDDFEDEEIDEDYFDDEDLLDSEEPVISGDFDNLDVTLCRYLFSVQAKSDYLFSPKFDNIKYNHLSTFLTHEQYHNLDLLIREKYAYFYLLQESKHIVTFYYKALNNSFKTVDDSIAKFTRIMHTAKFPKDVILPSLHNYRKSFASLGLAYAFPWVVKSEYTFIMKNGFLHELLYWDTIKTLEFDYFCDRVLTNDWSSYPVYGNTSKEVSFDPPQFVSPVSAYDIKNISQNLAKIKKYDFNFGINDLLYTIYPYSDYVSTIKSVKNFYWFRRSKFKNKSLKFKNKSLK